MAALTRADVVAIAKGLLDIKGTVDFSTSTINVFADMANRKVYRMLLNASPEHVISESSITWPASARRIDITDAAYLNAEPYKVLAVWEKPASGAVAVDNTPWEWLASDFRELVRYHQQDASFIGQSDPTAYSIQGNYMYAAPVPGAARCLDVYWVPQLAALASDATEVLSGLAESFGDMVGVCMAWMLNAKQEGQNPVVRDMWAEFVRDLNQHASSRQIQRPRSVRVMRRD